MNDPLKSFLFKQEENFQQTRAKLVETIINDFYDHFRMDVNVDLDVILSGAERSDALGTINIPTLGQVEALIAKYGTDYRLELFLTDDGVCYVKVIKYLKGQIDTHFFSYHPVLTHEEFDKFITFLRTHI